LESPLRQLLAQSLPAQVVESVLELERVAELELEQVAVLAQVERRQLRSRLLTSEMR
jgi:DNA recombination-dependent growth factor C